MNVNVAADIKEQPLPRRLDMDLHKAVKEISNKSLKPSKNAVDKAMSLCDEEFHKFNGEPMAEETGNWCILNRKEVLRRNL